MRPASIANYLDHLGQDRPDRNSPKRENSPFRPRSLNSPQRLEPRPAAPLAVARAPAEAGAQLADRGPPSPLGRRPAAPANPVESLVAREAAKAEEMAARLAEAYERGRQEGRREAQAKLEELRTAERSRGPGTGRSRAHRVSAQPVRPAGRNHPRRLCRDRREHRRRGRAHSGAVPRRGGRKTRDGRTMQKRRPPLRGPIARPDYDSRPRTAAVPPAPTDAGSAGRRRICRGQRGRGGRRSQPHPDRDRAAPVGRSARFARPLSGADELRSSGNRHRPTAQRARGRASWRGVEDRLRRFHDRDDGVLPRPVDHQRDRQEHQDDHRPILQSGKSGGAGEGAEGHSRRARPEHAGAGQGLLRGSQRREVAAGRGRNGRQIACQSHRSEAQGRQQS